MAKAKAKDALTYETLRDNYLSCRNWLHAWEEKAATEMDKPEAGQWWQVLLCIRCGTSRISLIGSTGEYIKTPRYKYPEGYRIDEKITRSELRVIYATRNNLIETPTKRRTSARSLTRRMK